MKIGRIKIGSGSSGNPLGGIKDVWGGISSAWNYNKNKAQGTADQWGNLQEDPAAKAAKEKALKALQDYNPMEGFDQAQQAAKQNAQGGYENLKQTRQAEGMGGAGSDLAMEQAKQQTLGAGDFSAGMERASLAKTAALKKTQQEAGMASDFRQQEFNEAATKAQGMAQAYGNAADRQSGAIGNIIQGGAKIGGAIAAMG